jgi:endonuclease/exonuclease/phosphatase family metal-dependent hydrolase
VRPAVAAASVSDTRLQLVTLNTAKETHSLEIVRQLRAAPRVRDADVILLQEVAHAQGRPGSVADEVAAELKMRVAYAPAAPGVSDQGLAIISRYPLREIRIVPLCRYSLLWHSRTRFALTATIDAPGGAIRISNAHLDTRVNGPDRVKQLEDALKDESPGVARIIAGDFNTNNFYWLGHALPLPLPGSQTGVIRRSMEKHGFVSALASDTPTFDHLGMHLDWVFSRGLRVRNTEVVPMAFSDHHAVWAELTVNR